MHFYIYTVCHCSAYPDVALCFLKTEVVASIGGYICVTDWCQTVSNTL